MVTANFYKYGWKISLQACTFIVRILYACNEIVGF